MILLAAAIAVSAPPDQPRQAVTAVVQARAAVRILRSARIQFDAPAAGETPPLRDARIRTPDGTQSAKLIQFE